MLEKGSKEIKDEENKKFFHFDFAHFLFAKLEWHNNTQNRRFEG